jgi:hypothetical protein
MILIPLQETALFHPKGGSQMDTTDKITLDLAQRIAQAVARSDEARSTSGYAVESGETATELGEVPLHLRHLHNLLSDMAEEKTAMLRILQMIDEKSSLVRNIFFSSLDTHFPQPEGADSIAVTKEWKVLAIARPDNNEDVENRSFTELMKALLGGGRRNDPVRH